MFKKVPQDKNTEEIVQSVTPLSDKFCTFENFTKSQSCHNKNAFSFLMLML